MRIVYYDCFAGISGDMHLGALLDLGVSQEKLRQGLALLGMDDAFEVQVSRGMKGSIEGTRVHVCVREDTQHMRTLADIERLIGESALPDSVKNKSLNVFRVLADAEGKVHAHSPYEVHFHEVGAVDALVDIVGGVICLEEINPDAVWVSPVELGSGFAVCSHGTLPVPAPAVAQLVQGFSVHMGGMPFEATTPTGAALLKGLQAQSRPRGVFTPKGVGYGLGMRDGDVPNVLRVWLGEAEAEAEADGGGEEDRPARGARDIKSYVVETNIDDMNPEWYTFIEERLFAAGAADVFRTPILMKKGRGAVQLSVLVPDMHTLEQVRDVLLTHTTTLGVRFYTVSKTEAIRRFSSVETPFGPVRVKWVHRGGRECGKPEYEDCHKIAAQKGLTLHEIYKEIERCLDKPDSPEKGEGDY